MLNSSNKPKKKLSQDVRQQHVLRNALINMANILELSQKELSIITGLSESSICRLYANTKQINPLSKEGELTILLLRLYRSLDTLLGGNEAQCRLWFRAYNHYFGMAPVESIKTIAGLINVLIYLDAMRGKA